MRQIVRVCGALIVGRRAHARQRRRRRGPAGRRGALRRRDAAAERRRALPRLPRPRGPRARLERELRPRPLRRRADLRRRDARHRARGRPVPEHGARLPGPRHHPGRAAGPRRVPARGPRAGAARATRAGGCSWRRGSSPPRSWRSSPCCSAAACHPSRPRSRAPAGPREEPDELPARYPQSVLAPLGAALARPPPARPERALDPRRELHRELLLERPREGGDRRLGDAGDRLPRARRRAALRAARLPARRVLLDVPVLSAPGEDPLRARRAPRRVARGAGEGSRPGAGVGIAHGGSGAPRRAAGGARQGRGPPRGLAGGARRSSPPPSSTP